MRALPVSISNSYNQYKIHTQPSFERSTRQYFALFKRTGPHLESKLHLYVLRCNLDTALIKFICKASRYPISDILIDLDLYT